jgi:drug/metabolite transporter (DMT)-like permease
LCFFWFWIDGWTSIRTANWSRGITVGGLGFGLGAILFLVGQSLSDPITPAIAASMMPIIGAILEVVFDGRRLHPRLLSGIVLAICGGLLATGTRFDEGSFGWGSLLCLCSVIMFAWATRATTHDFRSLSVVGRSAITITGGVIVVWGVFLVMLVLGLPGTETGLLDNRHMAMLVFSAVASTALAQFLWMRGNAGLGILLASFHMNAVPFYVMVIVVLLLDAHWSWCRRGVPRW